MRPASSEIRRRLNLPTYLRELSVLIGRPVAADELSSSEQAAAIREEAKAFGTQPQATWEAPFSALAGERFHWFVQRLQAANPSAIHVWTPRTIDCGVLVVPSLATIRFDFDFTINEDGILSFTTTGLTDRLLLDFWVSPAGDRRMSIETRGPSWSRVIY